MKRERNSIPRVGITNFIDMPPVKPAKRVSFTSEGSNRDRGQDKEPKYPRVRALRLYWICDLEKPWGRHQKFPGLHHHRNRPEGAWRGEIQDYLKTSNGERESTAPFRLRRCSRSSSARGIRLLFATKSGKPLGQSTVLRRTLTRSGRTQAAQSRRPCAPPLPRYALRDAKNAPEDLIKYWWVTRGTSITDTLTCKLKDDTAFRKEVIEAGRIVSNFRR